MRPKIESLFFKVYVLMAAVAGGLAGAFLLGGALRFSGPSFVGPRGLASWLPFEPHIVWGVFFLAYLLALVGALGRPVAVHVLRFGVVLYLFLTVSFASSVINDDRAAASGMTSYFVIAIVHLVLQDHLHDRGWEKC